jgi:acyl carrier protein
MNQFTKEDIFFEVVNVLGELFEIPAENIKLESHLNTDLGLDSIDAVDMVVKLQKITGRKFTPAQFKSIRTISDIVNTVHGILHGDHE